MLQSRYLNIFMTRSYDINMILYITLLTVILNLSNTHFVSADTNVDGAKQTLKDTFHEDLFIKPLVDGKLFAQFQFKTLYRKDIKSLRWENKIEIFPLSIADLVATTDINRLHFSLTKGNWNDPAWGYSTRPSPPGAQIRVVFSQHNENHERSWARLVNSLAGKFCASLASADKKTLVSTKLTFARHLSSPNSTEQTLYANLPEEHFCSENLTPWKKLLPCHSKLGLASLLNAVYLFKSSYSSLAIDIEPKPCIVDGQVVFGCEQVQLTQTISVVFNPLLLFENKQTWSLVKIFGNPVSKQTCPLASHSRIYVDITNLDDKSKLYPQTYTEQKFQIKLDDGSVESRTYATFDMNNPLERNVDHNSTLSRSTTQNLQNVGIIQKTIFKQLPAFLRTKIPIHFSTHVAGSGASDGTIVATITNIHDKPVRITYMDAVPHFLRVYLHTLTIKTKSSQELKPDKLNYVLSRETSPTLIEFSLVIPPLTEAQVTYDFERTFLRWTEYKPDANKGVLVSSALLGISPRIGINNIVFPTKSVASGTESARETNYLEEELDMLIIYARPLLFILPTPDFSMPYNVICMVCTALVAIFGVIHSITTKKAVIVLPKKSQVEVESKKDQ